MNYEFLSRTFLFQGTSPEETKHMLSCLKATPQSYAKGSTIWQVGDQVKTMGLVLNGSVHIENIDMMGNNRARSGFRRDICLYSRGKAAHRGDSCRGLPDPFSGGGKDFSHLSGYLPLP